MGYSKKHILMVIIIYQLGFFYIWWSNFIKIIFLILKVYPLTENSSYKWNNNAVIWAAWRSEGQRCLERQAPYLIGLEFEFQQDILQPTALSRGKN